MAKIIILGSYGPSLINFRGHLLKNLVQWGHEVTACAPEIPPDIKNTLNKMNVSCRNVPLSRTGLNPFNDYRTVIALRRFFLQEKPDIVLCYTIKPVIYGSIAARWAGVPNIYSIITGLGYSFIGNSLKQLLVGRVARVLYKIALKKNKRVFFQNPDDRDLFLKLCLVNKKQTVLINGSGVDLEYYRDTPLPQKTSFLLIARLLKEKGIYEYAEAAGIIKKKHPEIKFFLVGWIDVSPEAIKVEDLDRWQQGDLIDFRGKMEDVRPAIADTSIYVLPSYREGTPRTVLEAMAMGRPIITTNVPGCRETVVDGRNGCFVPMKDSAVLAEAMERFILQPELISQMGRESRKIAEEKYDVHKVNKVIIDVMMPDYLPDNCHTSVV